MSKEKRIEEMANEIMTVVMRNRNMLGVAETLYDAGYRKQNDGEWVVKDLNNPLYESKKAPHCSACGYMSFITYAYCPNCGAKMKGA